MESNDALERELKQLIVEVLKLEDMQPDEIDSSQPLFEGGLGLDSIDALEIGVAVQKRYGLKLDADSREETRQHFASIRTLAAFVERMREQRVTHAS